MFRQVMYAVGRAVRETGQGLDRIGCRIQGNLAYVEELNRHRRLAPLFDKRPELGQQTFVAPNASVIGDVTIGQNTAVWYGAVMRGDVNTIKVGDNSIIGEDCVVHVSSGVTETARPTNIGNDVIVDPGTILHACEVKDGAWVQSGSIVLDGSVVGFNSILGPGSLLTGKTIPDGEYWAGSPAKFVRKVTTEDTEGAAARRKGLQHLASEHDVEHSKTGEQRYIDKERWRPASYGVGFNSKF